MPKTRFNPASKDITLRIKNMDTLKLVNELATKLGNRNAVLNDALDIGVPILYARIFGKDAKTPSEQKPLYSPSVGRELKELRRVIDDLFVEMTVQETMLAGLYNAKIAALDGDDINAEALRDGSMCDLPELVAGLKSDLTETPKRGSAE